MSIIQKAADGAFVLATADDKMQDQWILDEEWVLRTAWNTLANAIIYLSRYSTRVDFPWFTGKCLNGQALSSSVLPSASTIARDGKTAVKKAWATMRKDMFLLTLFLGGTKKITTTAPDENTVKRSGIV
jgi:hypothetical protein